MSKNFCELTSHEMGDHDNGRLVYCCIDCLMNARKTLNELEALLEEAAPVPRERSSRVHLIPYAAIIGMVVSVLLGVLL